MKIELSRIGQKYLGVVIEDCGNRLDLGTLNNQEMIDLACNLSETVVDILCYAEGAEE